MKEYIQEMFEAEKIDAFAAVPFEAMRVIDRRQFMKLPIEENQIKSALVFLCPYFDGDVPDRNLSLYCVPRDYHLYFRGLFERLRQTLEKQNPKYRFFGVGDISPIDDVYAAAYAGLGVLGRNGLLIHETYSSFAFIGEILSDMPYELYGFEKTEFQVRTCENCGACIRACQVQTGGDKKECLSFVTQKKGELSESEIRRIREGKLIFGCDVCQLVCPHTKKMIQSGYRTGIDFFKRDKIYILTKETVSKMSKQELSWRAFGWRGRALLLRNLGIFDGEDGEYEEENKKNSAEAQGKILSPDDCNRHDGY